jgi:archaellum biogenesis protein FlaJ (TadC family)
LKGGERKEPMMSQKTLHEPQESNRIALTPEQEKSRRARNIAIALAVTAFMLLFYVVTIVKLGAVARPPV